MENSNLQTKAEYFKNKINEAKCFDEKLAIANYARKNCDFDFSKSKFVSKLKFKDGSKLEINTKLKAKILK